ncbi:MAG: hypothetical protein ACYCX0_11560, partial [Desulfurivibrionaceae bacterium]
MKKTGCRTASKLSTFIAIQEVVKENHNKNIAKRPHLSRQIALLHSPYRSKKFGVDRSGDTQ